MFVVDDQEVVRRGVRDLVNAAGGLLVVGEWPRLAEALARVPAARPTAPARTCGCPTGVASSCAASCGPDRAGPGVSDAHLLPPMSR